MSGFPPPIIRRATANDLLALHALLQRYSSEGDVRHSEDQQSLNAYLHQHPYGFPRKDLATQLLNAPQ
ncbi:MAG TPA: hypothetical protein VK814_01010 [Acidobacteriaceae bacterium]|jgi:hypothetical protein|nr:hypothetical protein [Acidobacteriaceae bacterium]